MIASRKGFTLIELLVVIAIIAILAAILFPVFARARAKAKQTQCLSNIKNVAMAYKIYTSDWFAYYPHDVENVLYFYSTNRSDPPKGLLATYVTSSDIMFCPLLKQAKQVKTLVNGGYLPNWSRYRESGYSYNGVFYNSTYGGDKDGCADFYGGLALKVDCGSGLKYIPASESWLESPGNTVLLVESFSNTSNMRYAGGQAWMCHTGNSNYKRSGRQCGYIWANHNNGANYAFCDGHARWVMNGTEGAVISNWSTWEATSPLEDNWWDIGPNSKELCERVTWLSDCACP